MQTLRKGALDIAKNALDESETRLSRIMHEQTYLLNCIGQVWTCERQILQRTSKAAVESRVVVSCAVAHTSGAGEPATCAGRPSEQGRARSQGAGRAGEWLGGKLAN
jgi:hypothetical protein